MNDSQLPAEISPKHSRRQGEVDETGKSEVEEGKSGENTQARDSARIGVDNEVKGIK